VVISRQALEEARAERQLCLLQLQRLKEEYADISVSAPVGPASKDIMKAIQVVVKNESTGDDHPLSLKLFARALKNDNRVSALLQANTEAQKQGAIEAVETLNLALGNPEGPISHSVILDLFFSPEAETEKLLNSMQRTKNQHHGTHPNGKLDHRTQHKAMATLESSLLSKLKHYTACGAALTEELAKVRTELAKRDAQEKQEMELVAALATAQRERNAVKEQQKMLLERNKSLRKHVSKEAIKSVHLVNLCSSSQAIAAAVQ
jgi:hypothetical protein